MNLPKGKKAAPTLIVAPLALLAQWKGEIEDKTDGHFSVLIYHGSGKPKKAAEIKKYDVVLTTYQVSLNAKRCIVKDSKKLARHFI
jgi:SNF2 family DNA or RNA helicase